MLDSRRSQSNESFRIFINGLIRILRVGLLSGVAYRHWGRVDKLKPAKESSGASTKTQARNPR